jgi:hypothetical protein
VLRPDLRSRVEQRHGLTGVRISSRPGRKEHVGVEGRGAGSLGKRRQRHEERKLRLKVSQELIVGGDQLTRLPLGQGHVEAVVKGAPRVRLLTVT